MQAPLVEEAPTSRPNVGGMPRRRSTNYIDALHNKAKSESTMNNDLQQSLRETTNTNSKSTPVFKPSYTTGTEAVPMTQDTAGPDDPARPDYYRSSFSSRGGGRPELGRKKSSFEYEDFKKDVYDRLNMFDKT